MFRGKTIKKRTKNRLTLLRNLRKGKARMEPRCGFQTIPMPEKHSFSSEVYHLYGVSSTILDSLLKRHIGHSLDGKRGHSSHRTFDAEQIQSIQACSGC